jgi:uncharacterized protein YggE
MDIGGWSVETCRAAFSVFTSRVTTVVLFFRGHAAKAVSAIEQSTHIAMRTVLNLLLFILTCSAVAAEPEIKGTASELAQYLNSLPKSVTIVGEGEVKVPADKAIVSLKVTTESKALEGALRSNQEVRGKLLGHLKKQGSASERVQASRFSSTPRFGWFGEKAKSYRVDNLVKITVQDEKEFQTAASMVDSFPEVQYVGTEFELEGKEALKAKVLAQACDSANDRKKIYEEKFGLQLVPVKFSGGMVTQKMPANLGNYPGAYGSGYGSATKESGAAGSIVPGLPIGEEGVSSFGELVYAAEVTVEFVVRPK